MNNRFERIMQAAKNSPPSDAQLAEWTKRDSEMGPNDYDRVHPDPKPRTALTGWDGRTIDIDNVQFAAEYAEREYTDPQSGILFGNWNGCSRRVQDLLTKAGYELEWEDEWTTCSDCGKAVRTSPDSYGYQPSYVLLHECEIVCLECLNGDAGEYLESLEDNPSQALNIRGDIDPAEYGYTLIQDGFENGWHPGQNDDPETIHAELSKAGHSGILFEIDCVGQFDICFKVWAKN